jgi:hypothetical protein
VVPSDGQLVYGLIVGGFVRWGLERVFLQPLDFPLAGEDTFDDGDGFRVVCRLDLLLREGTVIGGQFSQVGLAVAVNSFLVNVFSGAGKPARYTEAPKNGASEPILDLGGILGEGKGDFGHSGAGESSPLIIPDQSPKDRELFDQQ